ARPELRGAIAIASARRRFRASSSSCRKVISRVAMIRTSSVSSIRKRAKRANIPSQTAEMLRAARPDPSLAQKRRSLGMTNLLYASANLPLLDSSEDGFDAADGAVIFGALAARRS